MKKIKLVQAHLLFRSRNISGRRLNIQQLCVRVFLKHVLWPRGNELSPRGQSLVGDDGVVMQITVNYSVIIHANLHPVTGAASPRAAPPPRTPPRRPGPRAMEPWRQWGNVGPSGTEGGGLLVSRAWRSRILGTELARNKVVPSKPERERQGYSDGQRLRGGGSPPNTLLNTQCNRPRATSAC